MLRGSLVQNAMKFNSFKNYIFSMAPLEYLQGPLVGTPGANAIAKGTSVILRGASSRF